MQSAQYKRVLLKLSGEALAGEKGVGIDNTVVSNIAKSVKTLTERGIQVAIVVGGRKLLERKTVRAGRPV